MVPHRHKGQESPLSTPPCIGFAGPLSPQVDFYTVRLLPLKQLQLQLRDGDGRSLIHEADPAAETLNFYRQSFLRSRFGHRRRRRCRRLSHVRRGEERCLLPGQNENGFGK